MTGEVWQLGPLRVEPEQSMRGVFQVDVGMTTLGFPIMLVNGSEPDPVVLVTGGMDGDEYAASEAALRLFDEIDPAQLAGRVMICPILDPLSFEALHSQNPLDGLFLKHVFPGDLEGKPTQRLAYFIYQNFLLGADAWIDLQAADAGTDIAPFTWTYQGDDAEINDLNHILLRQSGAEIALMNAPIQWEPSEAATMSSTATLVSMAGRRFEVDPAAVRYHLHIINTTLSSMDMLPKEQPPTRPTIYTDFAPVLADTTGVLRPRLKAGDPVAAGQTLGEVYTMDGSSILQDVTSPVDGLVLTIRSGLAARSRLRLALVAHSPQQADERAK